MRCAAIRRLLALLRLPARTSHAASGEHAMTRAQLRGLAAVLLVVGVAMMGAALPVF
jgi:hypothetical protein